MEVKNYKLVPKGAFNFDSLNGYPDILENLEKVNWVKLNFLITERNRDICLGFYANASHHGEGCYTLYVIGKFIDYSAYSITLLHDLCPSGVCGIRQRRATTPTQEQWDVIKEDL